MKSHSLHLEIVSCSLFGVELCCPWSSHAAALTDTAGGRGGAILSSPPDARHGFHFSTIPRRALSTIPTRPREFRGFTTLHPAGQEEEEEEERYLSQLGAGAILCNLDKKSIDIEHQH